MNSVGPGRLVRSGARFLSTWLAGQCRICGLPAPGPRRALCAGCVQQFAAPVPRCRRCAIGTPQGMTVCGHCLRTPPPFARAIAAVDYGWPWAALVQQFKFNGADELTGTLATLLADAVARADGAANDVDAVIAVPLSDGRLRERGYNQSRLIARRVARLLRRPFIDDFVLKLHDTPALSGLSREERARSLSQAFMVDPTLRARWQGARLAVVDDVLTTGTTIGTLAGTLQAAGLGEVQAWVVARTPAPGE